MLGRIIKAENEPLEEKFSLLLFEKMERISFFFILKKRNFPNLLRSCPALSQRLEAPEGQSGSEILRHRVNLLTLFRFTRQH